LIPLRSEVKMEVIEGLAFDLIRMLMTLPVVPPQSKQLRG